MKANCRVYGTTVAALFFTALMLGGCANYSKKSITEELTPKQMDKMIKDTSDAYLYQLAQETGRFINSELSEEKQVEYKVITYGQFVDFYKRILNKDFLDSLHRVWRVEYDASFPDYDDKLDVLLKKMRRKNRDTSVNAKNIDETLKAELIRGSIDSTYQSYQEFSHTKMVEQQQKLNPIIASLLEEMFN
ncbi:MAG: hypothetical protein IKI67_04260 [Bacteroidales bacterium]|nr:hypothetical protein [Bacteroidales bacterium]